MFRKKQSNFTDSDFDNIINPFTKNLDNYIEENILLDFIAFYISSGYEKNALWESSLNRHINTALEYLSNCNSLNVDIDRLKHILEVNYGLKVISLDPLELEKYHINKK